MKTHSWGGIFDREKTFPFLLVIPAVVLLTVITVYPFVYNVWMSLHSYYLTSPQNSVWVGGRNYGTLLFQDTNFWGSLLRSAYFSGAAVATEFVFGFVIALLLNREFTGRNVLRVFLMLPLVATPIASVYVWRIMLNPSMGIINYFLRIVGLPTPKWIAGINSAMPSVILVDVWQWTPFVALILLAGLLSMPKAPFEAAKVDGCSTVQTFWYITMPLLKPIIGIVLVLRLMDSFKTFDIIYGLTGGGPIRVTETVNIYTYLTAFNNLDIGYACTLSIVMLILIILISLNLIKKFIVAELHT